MPFGLSSDRDFKNTSQEIENGLVSIPFYAGKEAADLILDSIACQLHNEGHGLKGNTAVHDQYWLARELWASEHWNCNANQFDDAPSETRQFYCRMAGFAIAAIPGLMSRVADRAILHGKVFRSLQDAVKRNKNRK